MSGLRKISKKIQTAWQCPSNIALVKYWGKKGFQLPINPSLSFSLRNSVTETSVELFPGGSGKLEFLFEGRESVFEQRIGTLIEQLSAEAAWMRKVDFRVESRNTFPHSAGIASSASAFGSLALCLADLDSTISGEKNDLHNRASRWARMGSGSASRSVFGGFAIWGKTPLFESSDDEQAIPLSRSIHPVFRGLRDAVLLVSAGEKEVSSSTGHRLMEHHPFKRQRIAQAHEHLYGLYLTLLTGDKQAFLEIAEAEAFALHALMMASKPPFLLLKPNSLEIIQRIKWFREKTGIPIGFTIDAGPNIHLLYFSENRNEVQAFIERELLEFCKNRRWIDDEIGDGPVKMTSPDR